MLNSVNDDGINAETETVVRSGTTVHPLGAFKRHHGVKKHPKGGILNATAWCKKSLFSGV